MFLAAVMAAYCGGKSSASRAASPLNPSSTLAGSNPETAVDALLGGTAVLVGAGDIGVCGSTGANATAMLLDHIDGTVFTAGDNAYASGTADDYRNCYNPTWGRHRARTRPSPGNHEYDSGGSGYYSYFGANAGPSGLGYYSFTLGSWRVLSLNSEVPSEPGSPQGEWVRAELSTTKAACTAVIWHRPLFSSGKIGDNPDMRPLWRTLYEFHVDLVINGHDHLYERFAPQDPDGQVDAVHGIREFIVGTGGAPLSGLRSVHPNSEARMTVWGVAKFTLGPGVFQWQFIPADDTDFEDSGSALCH